MSGYQSGPMKADKFGQTEITVASSDQSVVMSIWAIGLNCTTILPTDVARKLAAAIVAAADAADKAQVKS